MQYQTLMQWAKSMFGDNAPKSSVTLQRWARRGQIIPKPKKVGREWMVQPNARYFNPSDPSSLVERL